MAAVGAGALALGVDEAGQWALGQHVVELRVSGTGLEELPDLSALLGEPEDALVQRQRANSAHRFVCP